MLKVLIVDDEYYFRQSLKASIAWEELGFRVCGEANNGMDALNKAEQLQPDILLVDINMPHMDGLQMISEIKRFQMDSKIIILTGYSEFQYAKQAVELGVYNYLLKPVNEVELTDILLELKQLIVNERAVRVEMEMIKQKYKEQLPMFRDKLMNDLLHGNVSGLANDLPEQFRQLGIDTSFPYYRSLAIEMDAADDRMHEKPLWLFAVGNMAKELLEPYYGAYVCQDYAGKIGIIVGVREIENNDSHIAAVSDRICANVLKWLKFAVTIGIGNDYRGLKDMNVSYKEAQVALQHKALSEGSRVILHRAIEEKGLSSSPMSSDIRAGLLMSLRLGKTDEATEVIRRILSAFRTRDWSHEMLVVASIELFLVCLEFLAENNEPIERIIPKNVNVLDVVAAKSTIEELERWMADLFGRCIETVQRKKTDRSHILVGEAKQFIQQHYTKMDLKIEDICKHLYIHYAYICYIFKKTTGTTIVNYLTETRILKAKEHFDRGNDYIAEVAEKVGYGDANYFSKCFKKQTGVTPSAYIQSLKGK
ncbi:response regulator [Cohnella silvisoli]|uniref:Response regulator n=1 Tax=Cohnella silvisoli TaxID=2873699 RepID=A0ABV1KSV0_9BACL|nr:response regulator [Cohnella silvisoli]MCD9021294.1 response regulator [Cohnella silvisoli]